MATVKVNWTRKIFGGGRTQLARRQLGALEGRVPRMLCRWQRPRQRRFANPRLFVCGSGDLDQPNRARREDHRPELAARGRPAVGVRSAPQPRGSRGGSRA